jgi:hypothetical protein
LPINDTFASSAPNCGGSSAQAEGAMMIVENPIAAVMAMRSMGLWTYAQARLYKELASDADG